MIFYSLRLSACVGLSTTIVFLLKILCVELRREMRGRWKKKKMENTTSCSAIPNDPTAGEWHSNALFISYEYFSFVGLFSFIRNVKIIFTIKRTNNNR